jgi:hypothetical protein
MQKIFKTDKNNLIASLTIISGILIALFQFFQRREMGLDDCWLACNILDRSFAGLMQPLDNVQVAPILFLWIEKFFTILTPSEFGFRIFPLVCFILSSFLLLKLLNSLNTKNDYSIIILSFFVFNNALLLYSAQAKQYESDVLTLIAMFYTATRTWRSDRLRFSALAGLGAVAVFLSNVAPIILLTVGIYLAREEFLVTGRKRILPYIPVFGCWLLAFGIYYCFFIYDHPSYRFMQFYWRDTFLPLWPPAKTLAFLDERMRFTLGFFLPNAIPWFLQLAVYLLGLAALVWKRRTALLIFAVCPPLLHLLLSALQLYPFDIRLMLYTFPCFIVPIAAGIYYPLLFITRRLQPTITKIIVAAIPILLAIYYFTACYPQQMKSELKPAFDFVNDNIEQDESVYLSFFSTYRFRYYEKTGHFPNLKDHNIFEAGWTAIDAYRHGYFRETDRLKGKVWVIISGTPDEILTHHLARRGLHPIKEFSSPEGQFWLRGKARLYDFGN